MRTTSSLALLRALQLTPSGSVAANMTPGCAAKCTHMRKLQSLLTCIPASHMQILKYKGMQGTDACKARRLTQHAMGLADEAGLPSVQV